MKRLTVPLILAAFALLLTLGFAPSSHAWVGPNAFVCDSYSGQIAADTTWSPATCPSGYIITGNVLVQQGITLSILPGTTIKFDPNPTLTIEGKLVARGTADSPITFTANSATPAAGAWKGLIFNNSSDDATFDGAGNYTGGSIIQYALIEYAGYLTSGAITIQRASPYLDHATIRNNRGFGVVGEIEGKLRLSASMIQNNQGGGITLSASTSMSSTPLDIAIISNLIDTNNGGGIKIYNNGPSHTRGVIVISDSTVQNNKGLGVDVKEDTYDFSDTTLSGNTITGNQATGVYIEGANNLADEASRAQIIGNTISGNTGAGNYDCVGGLMIGSTRSSNAINGTIIGNTITNNAKSSGWCDSSVASAGGVALGADGPFMISGNTITGNTIGGGVEVRAGKPIINGNNIFNNTFGTTSTPRNLNAGPYSSSDPNLDVKNNWWGTTSIAEIEAGLYDYADSTFINQALYNPFRSGPVYLVRGRVTNGQGQPVTGVTISANTAITTTTTTDTSGSYFLSGLDAGSYTLTPTRTNFIFTPASLNVTVSNANLSGQDFSGTQTSYSITGKIVDAQGSPMTDVTVSDGAGHTTATDATGVYVLNGLSNGSYTLVPTRRGYTFTPASHSVTVQQQDVSGKDFTGEIVYYTISGTILNSDGSPLSYARVDAGSGNTVTTDTQGAYTFTKLQDNTYTIIPSGSYSFEPTQRVVTVGPSATGVDFVKYDPTNQQTLSGRVVDGSGKPLSGVVIANGKGLTIATDANGDYRFTKLPKGNYTLTPQLSDYFFTPRALAVNLTADTTDVNFVGGKTTDGTSLLINYPNGRQGSFFALVGAGYPVSKAAQIMANGRVIGNVTTDETGGFSIILSTAETDNATYTISVVINASTAATAATGSATTNLTIDSSAPLRAKEGTGTEVIMPAGLNRTFVYMPFVRR